jgi:predicted TIM-barrel fold metal-dependent hydrolase
MYDPVYAEAERLGVTLGIHGTRAWGHEVGANQLSTFAEVHTYAFAASLILHFTSVVFQGVTVRFPKLRLAFLEIGATWLPYYLDRMDEHWEKRGEFEAPLLKRKPSEVVRDSDLYFSVESGETQLAHTIEYLGDRHFVYASDIPHWDNEFPESLEALWARTDLSRETKEKLLYHNAKALFRL